MRTGPSTSLRHRFPVQLASLAGVLLAGALVAATPLQAAASTSYGVNLVQNPGAESGLNHWDAFLAFKTHKYGPSGQGLPSTHTGNQISGGTRFFYAGDYDNAFSQCPELDQTILLTGIGSAIDTGHVRVSLSAYAGTDAAAQITAHVRLEFRTAGSPHSVAGNDFVKQATSTAEHYKHLTASKILTKHTRTLILKLYADGADTTGGCYAFWDNISVQLTHV
jgi:hypothetical protein